MTSGWVTPLLQLLFGEEYRNAVLIGVIPYVGGIAQSTAIDPNHVLIEFLVDAKAAGRQKEVDRIGEELLTIAETNAKNERLILPLLKILQQFLSRQIFTANSSLGSRWLEVMQRELSGQSKDVVKVLVGIQVLCWFLLWDDKVKMESFAQLLKLLLHRFPKVRTPFFPHFSVVDKKRKKKKVRKMAGDELFMKIATFEEIVPKENLDKIQEVLATTAWIEELTEATVKAQRSLYALLGMPVPQEDVTELLAHSQRKKDSDYAELVKETGY
jgi:hypothetical protein